jgi:hypothetical protein
MSKVWVQLGDNGEAVRIFKNQKEMFFSCPVDREACVERSIATGQIRAAIWARQKGTCIRCPNLFTYAGMHLHEVNHRGRGGNISLENSVGLCHDCHLGARGVHPEKQIRFSGRKDRT